MSEYIDKLLLDAAMSGLTVNISLTSKPGEKPHFIITDDRSGMVLYNGQTKGELAFEASLYTAIFSSKKARERYEKVTARVEFLNDLRRQYDNMGVYVIGRTAYRSARIGEHWHEFDRRDVEFLENQIPNKDNHVVLIIQRFDAFNKSTEPIYLFLHDDVAIFSKEIIWEVMS